MFRAVHTRTHTLTLTRTRTSHTRTHAHTCSHMHTYTHVYSMTSHVSTLADQSVAWRATYTVDLLAVDLQRITDRLKARNLPKSYIICMKVGLPDRDDLSYLQTAYDAGPVEAFGHLKRLAGEFLAEFATTIEEDERLLAVPRFVGDTVVWLCTTSASCLKSLGVGHGDFFTVSTSSCTVEQPFIIYGVPAPLLM